MTNPEPEPKAVPLGNFVLSALLCFCRCLLVVEVGDLSTLVM